MTIPGNCSELSRFTCASILSVLQYLLKLTIDTCLVRMPIQRPQYWWRLLHTFGLISFNLHIISQIRLAGMVTCIFWVTQVVFTMEIEEMNDIQTQFCTIFRIGCLVHYEVWNWACSFVTPWQLRSFKVVIVWKVTEHNKRNAQTIITSIFFYMSIVVILKVLCKQPLNKDTDFFFTCLLL